MLTKTFFSIVLFCSFSNLSFSQDVVPGKNVQPPDSAIFDKVEQEAEFPGGVDMWKQYLTEHLDPNVPVRKKAKAGSYMVVVRFIVNKDGSLSDVEAETHYGHGMEKEVVRVMKSVPKWQPALVHGKTVRAYRRQPVTFVVSN